MLRFLGVSIFLLVGSLATVAWAYISTRELRSKHWGELVAMLVPVPWDGLEQVAREDPTCTDVPRTSPQEMFDRMGGWNGLGAIHHNARVLAAIIACAERWDEEQAARIKYHLEQEIWVIRVTAVLIVVDLLIPALRPFLEPERLIRRTAKAYCRSRNCIASLYGTHHANQMRDLLTAM